MLTAGKVVATYKSLARVERDFRSIKSIDLDLRPIHHWTETRVRAHVFICMLASYLAPTPGLGPADVHRRATSRPG